MKMNEMKQIAEGQLEMWPIYRQLRNQVTRTAEKGGGGSQGNCPGARVLPGVRRKRSFAFSLYVAMISSSWAPQGARKIEFSPGVLV